MGHANIETTMLYLHYVPQHDDAAGLTAAFARAVILDHSKQGLAQVVAGRLESGLLQQCAGPCGRVTLLCSDA
jgi:hypothetical protein